MKPTDLCVVLELANGDIYVISADDIGPVNNDEGCQAIVDELLADVGTADRAIVGRHTYYECIARKKFPDNKSIVIFNGEAYLAVVGQARARAYSKADAQASADIEAGFIFEGNAFSLSLPAQISLNGVWSKREISSTFPLLWPSKDDSEVITLENQARFEAFHSAAFDKVRVAREAAAAIKAQVSNALTVEDIAEIIEDLS